LFVSEISIKIDKYSYKREETDLILVKGGYLSRRVHKWQEIIVLHATVGVVFSFK